MQTQVAVSISEDWRLWCRLCAKEDTQGNISVFFKDEQATASNCSNGDLSLATAIEKYFWVNITREEELPKMLCTECFSLVTALVNFAERVTKVQQLFDTLQSVRENDKLDLHAVRLKYGLLDEYREHVLMPQLQQQLPEVHYFESKPKINELEENLFEAEPTTSNPLEQPRIKIRIKKENILEEHNEDEDDPFNGDESNDDDDDEFMPAGKEKDSSSSDEEQEPQQVEAQHEAVQLELAKLQEIADSEPPPKKRRKRSKRKVYDTVVDNSEDDAEADIDADSDIDATLQEDNQDDDNANRYGNYACTECPRRFKRIQHFRQHMKRTHSIVLPVPSLCCTHCTRVFTTQHQLVKHAKAHLPMEQKKVEPCPYCDKKFTSCTLVQTHIKHIHMNERPFICEECGVAVRTNASLKTHMLTHTDYAPYECEVCKKGFKNQIRLRNHMETHDPNKHICAECGLQLNSRATLNRHLLVHSDEMQHKCDYCGRAFKRAKALKNHLILHTGLKPYSCDFCDRTFANGSNCRSHKKKSHPEELAALEAAGGGKAYTRNIPKLEALKAVTKAADNLAPVVSKQSGRFASGRKPKPIKDENVKPSKMYKAAITATTTAATNAQLDLNSLHPAVPNTALMVGGNVAAIPTIDNIYSHIMKQATIAANNANAIDTQDTPSAGALAIHIKRPPSQASSCAIEHETGSSDVITSHQLHLQQQQQHSQPSTPNVQHHFYTHIVKQINVPHEQQLQITSSSQHTQQHHILLTTPSTQQQTQHDEIIAIRSPDSQASHITDDHSNPSAHFYNHIRQNLHGPYM